MRWVNGRLGPMRKGFEELLAEVTDSYVERWGKRFLVLCYLLVSLCRRQKVASALTGKQAMAFSQEDHLGNETPQAPGKNRIFT